MDIEKLTEEEKYRKAKFDFYQQFYTIASVVMLEDFLQRQPDPKATFNAIFMKWREAVTKKAGEQNRVMKESPTLEMLHLLTGESYADARNKYMKIYQEVCKELEEAHL